MDANQRLEALGPAERIINTITRYVDHAVHNRPGIVTPAPHVVTHAEWRQGTWVKEGNDKVVYLVTGGGKKGGRKQKQVKTRLGIGLPGTDQIVDGTGRVVGRWQPPGLFPETVAYLYEQIAEVWRIDNEFAARWASYAFDNEKNRDLKVLLAAFMLVQNRSGELIKVGDEKLADEDYRAVGEAMCLIYKKGLTFNAKLLLRIGDVLRLPQVQEINRKLGFGRSARTAPLGRYNKMVEKWLMHMEANPKLLVQQVKELGFRRTIMQLCRRVGYRPQSERFFEILRWKQAQAKDGRRALAIGKALQTVESWKGKSEREICELIVKGKPGWKRIVGMLPIEPGLTPAIMSAAIESGCLSDADLIIATPTLEELGLLEHPDVTKRWKAAIDRAENQRAANIAKNVKAKEVKEQLEQAADTAAQKAVAEVAKDFRIYVCIDKSGSMEGAIAKAKEYCAKLVSAFPLERLHVGMFNTVGVEVAIKTASAAGVTKAFMGHAAGGGTSYAAGIHALLRDHPPKADEDMLVFFVGDEDDPNVDALVQVVNEYGHRLANKPLAFGLLHVDSPPGSPRWLPHANATIVRTAAARLGIPCFELTEELFADPYAVPRVLRNLVAATPVRKAEQFTVAPPRRVTLVDTIMRTPLLAKPAWA